MCISVLVRSSGSVVAGTAATEPFGCLPTVLGHLVHAKWSQAVSQLLHTRRMVANNVPTPSYTSNGRKCPDLPVHSIRSQVPQLLSTLQTVTKKVYRSLGTPSSTLIIWNYLPCVNKFILKPP